VFGEEGAEGMGGKWALGIVLVLGLLLLLLR